MLSVGGPACNGAAMSSAFLGRGSTGGAVTRPQVSAREPRETKLVATTAAAA